MPYPRRAESVFLKIKYSEIMDPGLRGYIIRETGMMESKY